MYDADYEKENADLAYPITCETTDLDGNWILVDLIRWLGAGKWLALDEDGETIIVDSKSLKNPRL